MTALVLSLVALLVPPALVGRLGERPSAAALLDGLVLATIGGLVLLDVLPEALEGAGWWALAAVVAGFALPALAERGGLRVRGVHDASLVVGQALLLLHAALDGIALATAAVAGAALAVAVVLHQVPVGLAIWASARARVGDRAAWGLLAAMGAATVAGYVAGGRLVGTEEPALLAVFEGAAAGTLLHVVGHGALPGAGRAPTWAGAGALAALAALLALHAGVAEPTGLVVGLVERWGALALPALVGIGVAMPLLRRWPAAAGAAFVATVATLGLGPAAGALAAVGAALTGFGGARRPMERGRAGEGGHAHDHAHGHAHERAHARADGHGHAHHGHGGAHEHAHAHAPTRAPEVWADSPLARNPAVVAAARFGPGWIAGLAGAATLGVLPLFLGSVHLLAQQVGVALLAAVVGGGPAGVVLAVALADRMGHPAAVVPLLVPDLGDRPLRATVVRVALAAAASALPARVFDADALPIAPDGAGLAAAGAALAALLAVSILVLGPRTWLSKLGDSYGNGGTRDGVEAAGARRPH